MYVSSFIVIIRRNLILQRFSYTQRGWSALETHGEFHVPHTVCQSHNSIPRHLKDSVDYSASLSYAAPRGPPSCGKQRPRNCRYCCCCMLVIGMSQYNMFQTKRQTQYIQSEQLLTIVVVYLAVSLGRQLDKKPTHTHTHNALEVAT